MHKQLKKAINLSRKTGDRLIVYDMNRDDSTFVVMNLDDYEKLVLDEDQKIKDLTEGELLDKINRDIADWKTEQVDANIGKKNQTSLPETETNEHLEDYTGRFEPTTLELRNEKPRQKKSARWKIPSERKENAEEVIEEDRQYLEEVDF